MAMKRHSDIQTGAVICLHLRGDDFHRRKLSPRNRNACRQRRFVLIHKKRPDHVNVGPRRIFEIPKVPTDEVMRWRSAAAFLLGQDSDPGFEVRRCYPRIGFKTRNETPPPRSGDQGSSHQPHATSERHQPRTVRSRPDRPCGHKGQDIRRRDRR